MLIVGIDLCNEAILAGVDLHQSPEFRKLFRGINTAEVVALGWGFAIKTTNPGDCCGGIEGLLTQSGHQRLTEGSLIQDNVVAAGIRPASSAPLCSDGHKFSTCPSRAVVARTPWVALNAMAGEAIEMHSLNKHGPRRRNQQIQDNLHLVRPIARHYAQQTGQDHDDLLQVGSLGLIKASTRFDPQRGSSFSSFAKAHIRGAILHFLRDKVGLIRLPRAVEERAMRVTKNAEGCLTAAESLDVHHYRHKHHWVEFNDELVDESVAGIEIVERSDAWMRVREVFQTIGPDDQLAVQMVVIDGLSLRTAAQHLGISAMTVQRRVKRGLNRISTGLREGQADV